MCSFAARDNDRKIEGVVRDKKAIAKSFGSAACTYNRAAALQKKVGDRLLAIIDERVFAKQGASSALPKPGKNVLDLGSGTGYLTNHMASRADKVYALDIAEGMLHFAKYGTDLDEQQQQSVNYLCADAEAIPLKDSSVDIIVSNFAIQWCPNKDALFKEISRVLSPAGVFIFSLPGVNTLHELKASWQKTDPFHSHVNQFCNKEELENGIVGSGLSVQLLEEQTEVMHYSKLQELTRELKAVGAHNVTDGRARQLTGKGTLKRLVAAYDEYRDNEGMLPATWNVIYGVLLKPE